MSNLSAPGNLTATGLDGSVNDVTFSGNNDPAVKYEIWRRHGDSGDWSLQLTTTEQAYKDSGVTPGQYYEYKVRAVSGESISEFSESAVTYGRA